MSPKSSEDSRRPGRAARRLRYSVAMSLDGYLAGPDDEFDWIPMDPEIDFGELLGGFDTVVMGRRSYQAALAHGEESLPQMKTFVASRTLRPEDHPRVTILGDDLEKALSRLLQEPGGDVWLFGGGSLFRSLLAAGLVDTVEVAVIPILLGGGKPFLESPVASARLQLTGSRVYETTGTVWLTYSVEKAPGPQRR